MRLLLTLSQTREEIPASSQGDGQKKRNFERAVRVILPTTSISHECRGSVPPQRGWGRRMGREKKSVE